MAWGSSFDKPKIEWPSEAINKLLELEPIPPTAEEMACGLAIRHVGYLGNGTDEVVAKDIAQNEWFKQQPDMMAVRSNKVPTHDPYTNPNAHIYYECKCGKILDPGTKRFAELNNCASRAGWKIRFGDSGYVPYCVECGKGVE